MKFIKAFIVLLIFMAGSVAASARGQVPPPPPFLGGNMGGWLGDGGSGPIFGFADPWGKDMPFGTGGVSTPDFTGWIDDGNWARGTEAGNPGGYPGGSQGGNPTKGCPGSCQSPSLTGDCIPLCYCRPYYHGYPGDLTCDDKRGQDWNGRMCYILRGSCPPEKKEGE